MHSSFVARMHEVAEPISRKIRFVSITDIQVKARLLAITKTISDMPREAAEKQLPRKPPIRVTWDE